MAEPPKESPVEVCSLLLQESSAEEPPPPPPRRRLAAAGAAALCCAALGLAALAARAGGGGHAHGTVQQQGYVEALDVTPEGSWPYPSLFCWLVFMGQTYEAELVRSQFKEWLGIFTCDEYAAYSDFQSVIGSYPDGNVLMSVPVGDMSAPRASWGTRNAPAFLRVWGEVVANARYARHDFVVKVDPDTVFIPWRLQRRLRSVPGGLVCFFKNSEGGAIPMVGPLEVLSRGAVALYAQRGGVCNFPDAVAASGEDGWLGGCMVKLGVEEREDLEILKNGLRGPTWDFGPCLGSEPAAYHPFKNFGDWLECKASAER